MQCKWFPKCTQNPCNLTFFLIAYSSFRVQFYWVVCVEQLWSLHTTHVVFHQFLYLEHDDCLNSPVPPTMSTAYLLQLHVICKTHYMNEILFEMVHGYKFPKRKLTALEVTLLFDVPVNLLPLLFTMYM